MADNFKDLMDEIAPPFLLTEQGRPFVRALGDVKDSLVWRAREAVKARFPEFGTDDELARIGLERQIPRAAGEGRDSYSSRLIGAWDAWTWSAQAYGMVAAFYDSGYTNVRVATYQRRMYDIVTRVADPLPGMNVRTLDAGSWKFGTLADTFWAKFVVIFPNPLPASWVSGGVPGSGSDEANAIRALIRRWKPGHMVCDSIIIAGVDDETFDYFPAGGTWDDDPAAMMDDVAWVKWTP